MFRIGEISQENHVNKMTRPKRGKIHGILPTVSLHFKCFDWVLMSTDSTWLTVVTINKWLTFNFACSYGRRMLTSG